MAGMLESGRISSGNGMPSTSVMKSRRFWQRAKQSGNCVSNPAAQGLVGDHHAVLHPRRGVDSRGRDDVHLHHHAGVERDIRAGVDRRAEPLVEVDQVPRVQEDAELLEGQLLGDQAGQVAAGRADPQQVEPLGSSPRSTDRRSSPRSPGRRTADRGPTRRSSPPGRCCCPSSRCSSKEASRGGGSRPTGPDRPGQVAAGQGHVAAQGHAVVARTASASS